MFCVYYTEEIRNVWCACRREPISARRLRDVPSSSAIKRPRLISFFLYSFYIFILRYISHFTFAVFFCCDSKLGGKLNSTEFRCVYLCVWMFGISVSLGLSQLFTNVNLDWVTVHHHFNLYFEVLDIFILYILPFII